MAREWSLGWTLAGVVMACNAQYASDDPRVDAGSADAGAVEASVVVPSTPPAVDGGEPPVPVADAASVDATAPRCSPKSTFTQFKSLGKLPFQRDGASIASDELSILLDYDPAALGEGDLYRVSRTTVGDAFANLELLGGTINTSESEISPFLTADTRSLYFGRVINNRYRIVRASHTVTGKFESDKEIVLPNGSAAGAHDSDFTTTADELDAFFLANARSASSEIRAVNRDGAGTFTAANTVSALGGTERKRPRVTADGLGLYYVRDSPNRIWLATRATRAAPFGAPVLVTVEESIWNLDLLGPSRDSCRLYYLIKESEGGVIVVAE